MQECFNDHCTWLKVIKFISFTKKKKRINSYLLHWTASNVLSACIFIWNSASNYIYIYSPLPLIRLYKVSFEENVSLMLDSLVVHFERYFLLSNLQLINLNPMCESLWVNWLELNYLSWERREGREAWGQWTI